MNTQISEGRYGSQGYGAIAKGKVYYKLRLKIESTWNIDVEHLKVKSSQHSSWHIIIKRLLWNYVKIWEVSLT